MSLEAALCAVISSDCINKGARGISIALQIMIMEKKKIESPESRYSEKTGSVPQSRQTHLYVSRKGGRGLPSRPWKGSRAWSVNPRLGSCLGCIWDGLSSPLPGSCVDFDSCWVPERWFGDFAFRSLVSFYFPPLFSLTDRRALSGSGPCSFFFLGP